MLSPPPGPTESGDRRRLRLTVTGTVQGVGFRPFVYREATALGLAGRVRNAPAGVTIEAEGPAAPLDALVDRLRTAAPPAARVESVRVEEDGAPTGLAGFAVEVSTLDGPGAAAVPADLATCPECLAEIRDPSARRHRYPFTACTNCGPRYSVVEAMPYDRARTTMRGFPLCADCAREYADPSDRRFHAEATACPACGPRLALTDMAGGLLARDDAALAGAVAALSDGRVVAVKGVGGFHLMVDAGDEAAVRALRARKARPDKPFAVMVGALDAARALAAIDDTAAACLAGPAAPILLLDRRAGGAGIAPSVAPGLPWLGVFLACTPLHHLLLDDFGGPVVATSGNRADEPIATDGEAARARLAGIADLVLDHDRPIARPLDDSVMRLVAGRPMALRRGRGLAPATIAIAGLPGGILAMGGHQKAALALTRPGRVEPGRHLGDLDTPEARDGHAAAIADLSSLPPEPPTAIAVDAHPDYHATRAGEAAAAHTPRREPVRVPHHLAHVLACLADNGVVEPSATLRRSPTAEGRARRHLPSRCAAPDGAGQPTDLDDDAILGLTWDGSGYGTDGTVWGGEALVVDAAGWRRVARLAPFPLPGGEAAVRDPRRSAIGLLHAAFGEAWTDRTDLAPVAAFTPAERRVLAAALARGLNAPVTSSVGRLFDAVAALAGLAVGPVSYEGQAAAALEAAATGEEAPAYPTALTDDGELIEFDWRPMLDAILADRHGGADAGRIAAAFHAGLAATAAALARRLGARRVALTGGCFQNRLLAESCIAALRASGVEALWHRDLPPNDGGLAVGQALWAARVLETEREEEGETPCASPFRAG
ncbi:MAG: carbamoyltransferase HypF [Azospirillaceae bacterium]